MKNAAKESTSALEYPPSSGMKPFRHSSCLLSFLIIEFRGCHIVRSSTCTNLSMYLILCEGNAATTFFPETQQCRVWCHRSLIRTALISISNGLPDLSLHNSQLEPDHITSLDCLPTAFMLLT